MSQPKEKKSSIHIHDANEDGLEKAKKEDDWAWKEAGGAALCCDNILGLLIDKIFLGNIVSLNLIGLKGGQLIDKIFQMPYLIKPILYTHFVCFFYITYSFFIFFISVPPFIRQIRPLFKFGDEEKIKDGLINFVTSAGVVSALLIGISSGQAFSVSAYDFMSSICVFAWYFSTWMSMWCVVLSTGLGVLLSITPQQNLREVGQKLLYLWVLPAWLMIFSCVWMFVAIWAQAEMGYRLVLALNQTSQPHLATQQAIIVWVSRLSFVFTCMFGSFALLMIMFCAHKCKKYTGIETIEVAPADSKKGKELLKLHALLVRASAVSDFLAGVTAAAATEAQVVAAETAAAKAKAGAPKTVPKDIESKIEIKQEKKKRSKSRAGTEGLVSTWFP